jgi:hypothetical protein
MSLHLARLFEPAQTGSCQRIAQLFLDLAPRDVAEAPAEAPVTETWRAYIDKLLEAPQPAPAADNEPEARHPSQYPGVGDAYY